MSFPSRRPTAIRLVIAGLMAALVTLASAPAGAEAVTKYRVSISGTYEAAGTVTRTDCAPPAVPEPAPSTGPREPSFEAVDDPGTRTLTGAASLSATFRTVRPTVIAVQRRRVGYPAVNLADDDRPLVASADVRQSSTLEERNAPRGCSGTPVPASDCRARTLRFDIGFGARPGGLAPDLSKNAHKLAGGPQNCLMVDGMGGFPRLTGGHGVAKVAAARLLSSGRMVLTGGRTGSETVRASGTTGGGSYRLRYTLTLVRVR